VEVLLKTSFFLLPTNSFRFSYAASKQPFIFVGGWKARNMKRESTFFPKNPSSETNKAQS